MTTSKFLNVLWLFWRHKIRMLPRSFICESNIICCLWSNKRVYSFLCFSFTAMSWRRRSWRSSWTSPRRAGRSTDPSPSLINMVSREKFGSLSATRALNLFTVKLGSWRRSGRMRRKRRSSSLAPRSPESYNVPQSTQRMRYTPKVYSRGQNSDKSL
jgi:hypothetical protein